MNRLVWEQPSLNMSLLTSIYRTYNDWSLLFYLYAYYLNLRYQRLKKNDYNFPYLVNRKLVVFQTY